jgi:predicted nucleotidyltransferase component of viral defense system
MDALYSFNQLYPFQNRVLYLLTTLDTGFYLTGGTALSRGFLNHRLSEDLDFFVNDDNRFPLWADRVIRALAGFNRWHLEITTREERFVRMNLVEEQVNLKIDLINDVPSRLGAPTAHPVLGKLDTPENILANKVTAVLDRTAPKDLADIWGLCCVMELSLDNAITGAQGKAAGVFPVDLARVLCSVTRTDWEQVQWISPPVLETYLEQIDGLGKRLIFPN